MNNYIHKVVISPLYKTINSLNKFKINSDKNMVFSPSNIDEFNHLNMHLEKLTTQTRSDYRRLKEFTENTAHELQTPLAVIISRIENLLREAILTEKQMTDISVIYNNTIHVSKMSKSLNLLTKIENSEFYSSEEVNMSEVLSQKIEEIEELAIARNIRIDKNIKTDVKVSMNPFLLDILLINLISNAIKYNLEQGLISLSLSDKEFVITNDGLPLKFSSKNVFEKFAGRKNNSKGIGLGLSIVKKICNISGIEIAYQYINRQHSFRLKL